METKTPPENQTLYYIQSRGCVGNCALWWRAGGSGYTCDLKQAWKVTFQEAVRICRDRPQEDIPRPVELVDRLSEQHLDVQQLWRMDRKRAQQTEAG